VVTMLNKVKAVASARSLGNELFNSGIFSEACLAYGEGLKQHPTNKVLYANRAACWFKLGQWEKSVEDCNRALKIHPNYAKALLRRAASYGKVAFFFFNLIFLCLDLEVAKLLLVRWWDGKKVPMASPRWPKTPLTW
jgi:tetratricopeptide (TPR) repeat protein